MPLSKPQVSALLLAYLTRLLAAQCAAKRILPSALVPLRCGEHPTIPPPHYFCFPDTTCNFYRPGGLLPLTASVALLRVLRSLPLLLFALEPESGSSKLENDKGAKAELALSREFRALTPAIFRLP